MVDFNNISSVFKAHRSLGSHLSDRQGSNKSWLRFGSVRLDDHRDDPLQLLQFHAFGVPAKCFELFKRWLGEIYK